MPIDKRPEKYYVMSHSEVNAISNAAKHGTKLEGSTFYITGHPCSRCYGAIVNAGAKKIIYGPVDCVAYFGPGEKETIDLMNEGKEKPLIEMVQYDGDIGDSLAKAIKYMDSKCGIKLTCLKS